MFQKMLNERRKPTLDEKKREHTAQTQWSSALKSSIKPERVEIEDSELIDWKSPKREHYDAFLIEDVLDKSECDELIALANKEGFGTTSYNQDYRGNLRLMINDVGLTQAVFERIRDLLPQTVTEGGKTWKLVGLNELWRFAKYYPGHKFERHIDSYFDRSPTCKSMYTFNLYANDDFDEGRTRFYFKNGRDIAFEVEPEAGMALVFRQPSSADIVHDGQKLKRGLKYLFRSDVMYELQ